MALSNFISIVTYNIQQTEKNIILLMFTIEICLIGLNISLLYFKIFFCFRMLMPKKNRISIYEYLFKEGVMVAKKDYHAPKHPELELIPNLQVIKAMQSLKSRGFVKEQFAWRHFYW